MKLLSLTFLILLGFGCVQKSPEFRGDHCYEANGSQVSCEAFTTKLQEQEIIASVDITDWTFEISAVQLPAENGNFLCGLTPQAGKRYTYYFSEHSLIVETDGKILKFQKDNTSIGSILGQWVCYESNDRLLSAAHLNFVSNSTLRIHQLCR